MRKIFNLAAVAMLAVGVASCSKDAAENPGGEIAQTGNKFTFVLPSQSNMITYAGEVAASANEKKLDLTKTSIFMFDQTTQRLEAVIEGLDITSGTNSAGKPTATIEVQDEWTGNKVFHIVGNTDKDAADNLADVIVGTTTMTQFQELTTETQAAALSSATGLLMAGSVSVTNIEQSSGSDVTLYRSVARFDVDQDVTENKVLIKSIDVIDAKTNGYITAYGRGVKASGLTTGDINNIAVSQTLTAEDVDGTPADDTDDHNFQKQEGVMYLYPTNLKTDGTGTTIVLVGDVNGVEAIYTLNKEESNLPVDCEIKANTRYVISAIDILTHTFTLTVAEWDEGEELAGKPGVDASSFGLVDMPSGSAVVPSTSIGIIKLNAAGGTVTFTVKASSSLGTTFEMTADPSVEDHTSLYNVAVSNASAVSYAVPYFASTYTITIPDLSAKSTAKTTLTITDIKNPANTLDLDIIYTLGVVDGVISVDEYNFPDPALKDFVETRLGLSGEVTQVQLDNVINLNFPGYANPASIVSLQGIEYFRKVQNIALAGTSVTSIDLSKFTDLQTINGTETQIRTLDFSNNPEVTRVSFNYSAVSAINVAGCSKLEILYLREAKISALDLTGCSALRILDIRKTKVASLNLTNCPLLEEIYGTESQVQTLDFSNSPEVNYISFPSSALSAIDVTGCTKLETLYLDRSNVSVAVGLTDCAALKKLALNRTQITSIDVTNCPLLESLNVNNTAVSSLDVTNNPALTYLGFGMTNISTIDISNNIALTELTIPGMMSQLSTPISVTHLPNLTRLHLPGSVENIDLSNNPLLNELRIGAFKPDTQDGLPVPTGERSKLKSLDISNNPLITMLTIAFCPDLDPEIKVASGFPTTAPETQFINGYLIMGNTPALTYVVQ